MANSGGYGQSIHLKSPRSPRQLPQLPQLPQIPIAGRRSPTQLSVTKSPGTPLVFEFPPDSYQETPNTNFDFDDFGRATEADQRCPRSPRSLSYYAASGSKNSKGELHHSPGRKSPIFQFCEPRKSAAKSGTYMPKSPMSPSSMSGSKSPSAFTFSQKSPKLLERRKASALGFGTPKSPISPTIVTSSSHSPTSPTLPDEDHDQQPQQQQQQDPGKDSVPFGKGSSRGSLNRTFRSQERIDRSSSSEIKGRGGRMGVHFNKSQGCLNEAGRNSGKGSADESVKNGSSAARRSTSDLTEIGDAETEVTLLSSPRRGSMKGGLEIRSRLGKKRSIPYLRLAPATQSPDEISDAYLASRRGSRDSQCSNVSNEDVGPLNFSAHPRGRQRRTSNFLELPVPDHIRPRVHSLPEKAYNPRAGDDLYRLRAFSITHKGVVNRGDSIISRRSRSNTSVNSSRNSNVSGERSPFEGSCCSGHGMAADSTESEIEEVSKYRVVLLGDSGVGKTALVSQFMTSEYMNTYDASLDDEFGEKTVSVLLDGEESEMIFIDHPHVEMSVENSLSTYEPHACVVVYSIVSRTSFHVAEEILNYLWREHFTQERSVIVVGNKSDLARSRNISTNEGKQLATSRECKFIETSSGIQHNVDELLVGILKQIRLRETRDKKLRRQGSKGKPTNNLHGSKTALSLNLARDILNKMCLNNGKSKSCENLHVL